MRHKFDVPISLQGAAVASLVAVVACVLARDARANRLLIEPSVSNPNLSVRVSAIVERIRLLEPRLLRDLPPEVKIVQWQNRRQWQKR
jgi:hypothetical protein